MAKKHDAVTASYGMQTLRMLVTRDDRVRHVVRSRHHEFALYDPDWCAVAAIGTTRVLVCGQRAHKREAKTPFFAVNHPTMRLIGSISLIELDAMATRAADDGTHIHFHPAGVIEFSEYQRL